MFWNANAFNGDLSQWDVANVIGMDSSKSICIMENDLTWRELMLLRDLRVPSGRLRLMVMMRCKDCRVVVMKIAGE